MKILKKGATATPAIGPFVDTAGAAATGLTLIQTDFVLSKGGSTTYSSKTDSSGATHRSGGVYSVPLDATDTGTEGVLTICVNKTGALPLKETFLVTPANVFDALLGNDRLNVDTVELNSNATSAANLERAAFVIGIGTVTNSGHSPSITEFKSTDLADTTNDHFIGRTVTFATGNLVKQSTVVTDYVGSTGVFTVTALTEGPANGDTFVLG